MKTELQVELYAMTIGLEESAEGEVYISHHIHIKTETEIFYLPVLANILLKWLLVTLYLHSPLRITIFTIELVASVMFSLCSERSYTSTQVWL